MRCIRAAFPERMTDTETKTGAGDETEQVCQDDAAQDQRSPSALSGIRVLLGRDLKAALHPEQKRLIRLRNGGCRLKQPAGILFGPRGGRPAAR